MVYIVKQRAIPTLILFILISLPLINSAEASMELWSHEYGTAEGDYARAMIQTSDGGFALAGITHSFGAGSRDFWLVKTDEHGNEEWNQTYGGAELDHGEVVVQTSDGGYALAGYSYSFDSYAKADYWLVKTDAQGIIPEFPSWTILPLFLTATLAVIFYSERLRARLRHF